MSVSIGKYTALLEICSYALDELDKSIGDMDRCWLLGTRAIIDMGYAFAFEPKTVRIPKNGNQTATIPNDCMQWSKVGILNSEGEIVSLKINNALTTFRDNNPQRLQDLTPDINNSIGDLITAPYYYNYFYNGTYCNLYGVGNGLIQYGECKVDEVNRVIILDKHFKYDSVMFEYLSSPKNDRDYMVPTCLQEAVIAFIKWKLKVGAREEYYAAMTSGRRSLNNKKVTLQEINQFIRESNGMKLRS